MKEEHKTYVCRNVWGPDDTSMSVNCQVDKSNFKHGDKVKVTIEKVNE